MQIKTYKGKRIEKQFYFFILNKGNNSGKPLTEACANCYLLIAETKQEKDFYYWLCYGLWQSDKFNPHLCGSVIPFLRIKNLKDVIKEAEEKIKTKEDKFYKVIQTLIKLNKHYDNAQKQLQLIKQLKTALIQNVLGNMFIALPAFLLHSI